MLLLLLLLLLYIFIYLFIFFFVCFAEAVSGEYRRIYSLILMLSKVVREENIFKITKINSK